MDYCGPVVALYAVLAMMICVHFLNNCYSFQDDRGVMDTLAHSNHAELRPDNSWKPVLTVPVPNVPGATSLRPVMPTHSMGLI